MSKINTPETDTSEQAQSKGCGCGAHGKHLERSEQATNPNAAPTSKHADHGRASHEEHGSGCCGGSKSHK